MAEALTLDKDRTAVLVMDYQNDIVANFGGPDAEATLDRVANVIGAARNAGVKVVYVKVCFREGHPEVHGRNQLFSGIAEGGMFVEGTDGADIHPKVAPKPGEPVVTKRRVSGFAGSDLYYVLTGLGVDTVVLMGIATSGVVLSTSVRAADLDFRVFLVGDGCVDGDPEVHRVLTEKALGFYATTVTANDVIAALGK